MSKRLRLRLLARKAAGHLCVAGWLLSHNMRCAWQTRAMVFEALLIHHALPGHSWAAAEIAEMDEFFTKILSKARNRLGRHVVRESQTRTGDFDSTRIDLTTLH